MKLENCSLLRMCCFSLFSLLFVWPALPQTSRPGTAPITVAFCDLLSNPQAFDKQWIQVRGQISVAFEDFSLREASCDKPLTRNIWLTYGGDEETPIIYCCGDHTRLKGRDVVVFGQPIPLIRDSAMSDFIAKVSARRKRRVNGEPCDNECNFYRVSANIVGLFGASPDDPKKAWGGGFGHLGCCHLLVINRVFDVRAERTQVPDEESSFTCSKHSWQAEFPTLANSMLDRQAINKRFLAQQMRQHDDAELVALMEATISRHAGLTGVVVWSTPDLLTTYSVPYPRTGKRKSRAELSRIVTVTRERCMVMSDSHTP